MTPIDPTLKAIIIIVPILLGMFTGANRDGYVEPDRKPPVQPR